MNRLLTLSVFFILLYHQSLSQGFIRQTYHDKEKKNLKEVYHMKDTIHNVLQGKYISYYLNGNIESKGEFANNETTGVWEFFFETGNLKMRGVLWQSANYGLWEYFSESGHKIMEGIINGKNRLGEWKTYYENGHIKEVGEYKDNKRVGSWKMYFEDDVLKSETDYKEDIGAMIEYDHTGKKISKGFKSGTRNVGHWQFFAEGEVLQIEGDYIDGKKNGDWINYYPNGKISSKGQYKNDEQTGKWEYFFESGILNSSGEFENGKKKGYWNVYNSDGSLKSEVTLNGGSGEYKEYYASGNIKVKGNIVNEKREGKWDFLYEDGVREGECLYNKGKGTYKGYYKDGKLQTKGILEGDTKIGTWEIYEADGKLSGYYRPFYDDKKLGKEIVDLVGKSGINKSSSRGKRFNYFSPRFNEFKGVILGGNPILPFAGLLPVSIEFYLQGRLGHEFEFVGIRDPFFKADENIAVDKIYTRGYSISIKQKFYNPLHVGMWYFGHEIRFTNLGHFTNLPNSVTKNPNNSFTISATDQRIEWGLLVGYRIMKTTKSKGFTIDAFASADIGYRGFNVDAAYISNFSALKQSNFSNSFHLGLNFGNVFTFKE